jgi:Kef-type K+ transport system membrane component KefB
MRVSAPPQRALSFLIYPLMLVIGLGFLRLIFHAGQGLTATALPPSGFATGKAPEAADATDLLLALAVIMLAAQLMGAVARRLGQPTVMGEVMAGLMLGPSLLGWVAPELQASVFPPGVFGPLSSVARIGVILYMFFVGLELETSLLRHQGRSTVAISNAGILVPFVLGSGLALLLYPSLGYPDVPFEVFTLFMGASLSVTAFPVLARILTDRNMHKSKLGVLALSCAAVDDVTAWCLLAVVMGVAQSDLTGVVQTLSLLALYVVLMLTVVRQILLKLVERSERSGQLTAPSVGIFMLFAVISAWCTEAIGVHALFGAFLMGALIPHDSLVAREARARLYDVSAVLFLPAFFALTGMRTQIGGISDWGIAALIILVACVGKFGGSFVAARLCGHGNRESAALGVLMNTRGLIQLIVLNLGLEMRILSPPLFTMLVVMAVVTTFMTSPILVWLKPDLSD